MKSNEKLEFNSPVTEIKGIGNKKKDLLENLNIFTAGDMLRHFPFRFRDRRKFLSPVMASDGSEILTSGILIRKGNRRISGGRSMSTITFRGDNYSFVAVFFNMPYLMKSLNVGTEYSVFGKVSHRNGMAVFTTPEITEKGSEQDRLGIIPVYHCTAGITTRDFIKWETEILKNCGSLDKEWLGETLAEERKLCSQRYAYTNAHFPESEHKFAAARYRLVYEELLVYQVALRSEEAEREEDRNGKMDFTDPSEFIKSLPFTLTSGQRNAVEDIRKDLAKEKPMNRLIQGDVGCGKTVVAEAAVYLAFRNGKQSAVMAPTEILARQHFHDMSQAFEKFGIRTGLLVSSMKESDKKRILEQLCDGDIDLIVGTHSLLGEKVVFHNLGLVVTDEQHRFGVRQRRALAEKSSGVNVLVMSATPIPRTLASTVFGSMDFSTIEMKPASRLPVITRGLTGKTRNKAYAAVRDQLSKGHQAYVVAPSIDEDENLNSAMKLYNELKEKFRGYKVSLIHGRMGKDQKEEIMWAFARGESDILVSTVVIEVGINVPGATIIVIENSERFGLAQLHQLRGRVGRNDLQSYCYLINYGSSSQSEERVRIMTETSDGFIIAREDYRLRGPGDIMGTMQHGAAAEVSNLLRYQDILEAAGDDALKIISGSYKDLDMNEMNRRIGKLSVVDNSNVI